MKKFMVLDIEGLPAQKPYNIGYMICDRKGGIYKKRNFAILGNIPITMIQINSNENLRRNAGRLTTNNIIEILLDSENKKKNRKYQIVTNEGFIKQFLKDIKEFGIEKIFSFNSPFDEKGINVIFKDLDIKIPKFYDIATLIIRQKCFTKKYLDFCLNNNFLTEKGYPSTKAETLYRYLTNDLTFEEDHTGLKDCEIEFELLLIAFKQKKKQDFTRFSAYSRLNAFAKSINHPIAK